MNQKMKEIHIEIIVPCYNEQECIKPLYEELNRVFGGANGKRYVFCSFCK